MLTKIPNRILLSWSGDTTHNISLTIIAPPHSSTQRIRTILMQEASPIADGCAAKKQTAALSNETDIFSDNAKWIWDNGDRGKYNYYLRAKKPFFFSKECKKKATLLITAEAYYQVWINGRTVGHGPSKSAEGARAVDCYEVGEFLNEGQNLLEVLVQSEKISNNKDTIVYT